MQAHGWPPDEEELELTQIWAHDLWEYRSVYRRVSMARWNLSFWPAQGSLYRKPLALTPGTHRAAWSPLEERWRLTGCLIPSLGFSK